jgi:hypothetical protein
MITTIRSTAHGEIKAHVKGVQQAHENLVRPWERSEDKPKFDTVVVLTTGEIIGMVEMSAQEAEQASLSVWQLLDRGTRIRYMMVSDDWVSKTWPGRTTSGAGSGHTTGLDLEDPRGGIEERKFGENIAKEHQTSAKSHVEQGYKKGFKKAFG